MVSVLFLSDRWLARLFRYLSEAPILDFRLLDLDEYNRSQAVNLKPGNLEKETYVVSRGQGCHGFLWLPAPRISGPGVLGAAVILAGIASLGVWVYGYVARHRQVH